MLQKKAQEYHRALAALRFKVERKKQLLKAYYVCVFFFSLPLALKPFNMTELQEKPGEETGTLLNPEDVKIAIVEPKENQELFGPEENQVQGKKARDQWSKDIEFLLASIGYCVGVGNIWR